MSRSDADSTVSPADPNSERLVLFTDAVSAIAITLLVLPLVDMVPAAAAHRESVGELLRDHIGEIGSFALSFAVIFRFWWAHHQLFRHVTVIDWPLVRWSVLWTFAIVFLPLPTAIITAYSPSAATVGLYGGTLLVASGSLLMMAIAVHRDPRYSAGTSTETREEVLGSVIACAILAVAVTIGCLFAEPVNFWAFLLLFLSSPVEAEISRRWRRRDAERTARKDAVPAPRDAPGSEELH